MYIKITNTSEERSWYKDRVGDTFKVLKKSNINGEVMYIVHKDRMLHSFVLADDCVIMKECEKCGHLMLPDDNSECMKPDN